jgi:hypothetical protein
VQTMDTVVAYFLVILGMIAVVVGMLCGFILWMTKHYSQLWPDNGDENVTVGLTTNRDVPGRRTTIR